MQDSTPDDEACVEEAMHRAFSLAAQYIALAYALQPGKDVYAKSIQARSLCRCLLFRPLLASKLCIAAWFVHLSCTLWIWSSSMLVTSRRICVQ